MIPFLIYFLIIFGGVLPLSVYVLNRFYKGTVLQSAGLFLLGFLAVVSLLFYAVGAYGPVHLIWIIPCCGVLLFLSIRMVKKHLALVLNGVNDRIKTLAKGDLTGKVTHNDNRELDEIGKINNSINLLITNQSNVIKKLLREIENTKRVNEEVTKRSNDISQKFTDQASTLEEVSSSMEEMLANIEQNAANSKQTEGIAKKSVANIAVVNKAVEGAIESVREIIAKVSVINEFAMKTNLLSLNAAVEAARAGEHGRGFAVVASEVRKLAENSKTTANEINHMTNQSLKTFERSIKLLSMVVPEIQKTAELVQEITMATEEQRQGTDQINTAMQQLNVFTQENSAAVEDMNSYSSELEKLFKALGKTVSLYKLNQ
jgi:methyl-accepting chemotaxis protein